MRPQQAGRVRLSSPKTASQQPMPSSSRMRFEQKLSQLSGLDKTEGHLTQNIGAAPSTATTPGVNTQDIAAGAEAKGIDKSVLTVAEARRYRSQAHLRFVATKACLLYGRKPTDPHHLSPTAIGAAEPASREAYRKSSAYGQHDPAGPWML